MDRFKSRTSIYCIPMSVNWAATFKLLLSTGLYQRVRSKDLATSRRDLYKIPTIWFEKHQGNDLSRRLFSQPKTYSGNYATIRNSRMSTRPSYIKMSSSTFKISLSSKKSLYSQASSSLELGHNIYSTSARICLSRSHYRLVFSLCTFISALKQFGRVFLYRSIRRSFRKIWMSRNLQYGSGSSVFQSKLRRNNSRARYALQHGWKGKGFRQYICRAFMEICKI